MKNVHIIMPFTRVHLAGELVDSYRSMNVILHPITFETEPFPIMEGWIQPYIIGGISGFTKFPEVCNFKVNHFIYGHSFVDDDYYCLAADDDMYEAGVFGKIREMDNDVIFISMKRGHHIPPNLPAERQYGVETLYAHPDNVLIGGISGEQIIAKGKIFKTLRFSPGQCSDGETAIYLKKNYEIRYEPGLFALFNYYEPGRWDK